MVPTKNKFSITRLVNAFHNRRSWQMRYGVPVFATILSLLLRLLLIPVLSTTGLFLLFIPAITLSAWYGGLSPGLLATGLSCFFAAYFLVSPFYTLNIYSLSDVLRLGLLALVGVQLSFLSNTLFAAKRQAEATTAKAEATALSLKRSLKELSDMKFALDQSAIVSITDAEGIIHYVNDKFCEISQFSRKELIGQNHRIIKSGCHSPEFFQELWETIVHGKIWQGEIRNRAKGGSHYWVHVTIVPILNEQGNPFQYLGIQFDVTQRKQVEASLQELNNNLEFQVKERTAQLQQSLNFEATLKRITDKVRDSLDESQILQAVVQELGAGLGVRCCNASLYDLDEGTSTICYEYSTSLFSSKGRVSQMFNFPEIYVPLLQGQCLQFCNVLPNPIRGRVSMLACPIIDDQGILGDLWLIVDKEYAFRETELRLVQQVANQCAIALRQARLYEEAQTQVKTLEQINWLKDEFLSTVSHELRTPVSNMRMSIRMLEIALNQNQAAQCPPKVNQYLQILKTECEREISLINDLLDLQRLEAGNLALTLDKIHLVPWLTQVVQPFRERVADRQQTLNLILPPDDAFMTSDATVLERILAELLNNACKYTPPNGEIIVRSQLQPDTLQIQICNSGVEIPLEEVSRIFDKFYRIPKSDPWKQGGTGLGLALVQKLTHHLNGTIQVESGAGWTTFTIEIPLT